MRQYQLKETKEITKIICNRCGKETKVVSGIPKREMIHVEHTWGYFSGKDGESCSFDLCEECFDEITKGSSFQPNVKMNERVWFAVSGKP